MKVKVCGMKDETQINALSEHADYIGFIFYEKSPRFVEGLLPNTNNVERVGVFVNEDLDKVIATVKFQGLTIVQLHGHEVPAYCAEIQKHCEVIKAFGIDEHFDFSELNSYERVVSHFLFDTKTPEHGGSGKQYNWDILKKYTGETDFFLSGGINPDSLEEIKAFHHPKLIGIDLNSGFEINPANKNTNAITTFIHALNN